MRESQGTWQGVFGTEEDNHFGYFVTGKYGGVNKVAKMFVREHHVDIYDMQNNSLGSFDSQEEATEFMKDYCMVIEPEEKDLRLNKALRARR